jgi:hypothetical protein
MKKSVCLTVLFCGILAYLISGCSEDTETGAITANDLVGNWMFVSLEFNGNTTTDCDSALNKEYDLVTLSFKNVSTTSMTLYSSCTDLGNLWEQTYGYTIYNNSISLASGVVFDIEDASTNTTLKLKLTNPGLANNYPVGGVYTMNKEP